MKNVRRLLHAALAGVLFVGLVVSAGCSGNGFKSDGSGEPDQPTTGEDPLFKYAWHLSNTGQKVFAQQAATAGYDMDVTSVWDGGIYGEGVLVQISDDGLEDTHEDLKANFPYLSQSKNYTLSSPYTTTQAPPIDAEDNHGTSVAGLVAAVGWNARGSRGVAPKAHLTVANFLSNAVTQTEAKFLDQASGSFDVSNMSWGTTQNTIYTVDSSYETQLRTMATTGRSGKGAIFVKAAGNDYAVLCNNSTSTFCVGNSNFDSDNVIPYIIIVAAMNAQGASSSYSSMGSDVWISSFGGEYGDDSPAMLTTDRSGCSAGYSKSSKTVAFEKGSSGENSGCNYTSTFNGTSSASPTITGTVALILEANPDLTWREVKYILAKTAKVDNYVTGNITHPLASSMTLPSGFVWEQKWITNGAGFKFQNYYGFGRVDVAAAIALAKTFASGSLGTFTSTNWSHTNTGLSLAIPDNSATGVTNTLSVAQSLKIEAVQIKVNITHPNISELALELTSPTGTKSILVNGRNSLTGIADFQGETFLTNAFYQENSAGTWTLKVIDAKSGNTGTLTSFSLNIYGAP